MVVTNDADRLIFFDKTFFNRNVGRYLENYNNDLTRDDGVDKKAIMQVYRNNKLIFNRIEKTPLQLEMESIEKEQRELAEKQNSLAERMVELRKQV